MAKEAKPEAELAVAAAPKKSKKLLIMVATVLILVLLVVGPAPEAIVLDDRRGNYVGAFQHPVILRPFQGDQSASVERSNCDVPGGGEGFLGRLGDVVHVNDIFKFKQTGANVPIVYEPLPENDPKTRKPDITLAKKLLGWEPKITLEEGLLKTIPYFRKMLEK